MNKEEILKLADFVEKHTCTAFDMSAWYRSDIKGDPRTLRYLKEDHEDRGEPFPEDFCGTAACLAGFYAIMKGVDLSFEHGGIEDFAQEGLGLNPIQTRDLFLPDYMNFRTRAEGVKTLRNLAETGDARWPEKGEDEEDE